MFNGQRGVRPPVLAALDPSARDVSNEWNKRFKVVDKPRTLLDKDNKPLDLDTIRDLSLAAGHPVDDGRANVDKALETFHKPSIESVKHLYRLGKQTGEYIRDNILPAQDNSKAVKPVEGGTNEVYKTPEKRGPSQEQPGPPAKRQRDEVVEQPEEPPEQPEDVDMAEQPPPVDANPSAPGQNNMVSGPSVVTSGGFRSGTGTFTNEFNPTFNVTINKQHKYKILAHPELRTPSIEGPDVILATDYYDVPYNDIGFYCEQGELTYIGQQRYWRVVQANFQITKIDYHQLNKSGGAEGTVTQATNWQPSITIADTVRCAPAGYIRIWGDGTNNDPESLFNNTAIAKQGVPVMLPRINAILRQRTTQAPFNHPGLTAPGVPGNGNLKHIDMWGMCSTTYESTSGVVLGMTAKPFPFERAGGLQTEINNYEFAANPMWYDANVSTSATVASNESTVVPKGAGDNVKHAYGPKLPHKLRLGMPKAISAAGAGVNALSPHQRMLVESVGKFGISPASDYVSNRTDRFKPHEKPIADNPIFAIRMEKPELIPNSNTEYYAIITIESSITFNCSNPAIFPNDSPFGSWGGDQRETYRRDNLAGCLPDGGAYNMTWEYSFNNPSQYLNNVKYFP